jgi:hypothetical protein
MDLLAPTAWTTGHSSRHGFSGPSSGNREARPGAIAGSKASWPRWEPGSLLPACGQSFAGMASNQLLVDRAHLGRSSCGRRRKPCWPATSSPSTPSCSNVSAFVFIEIDTRLIYFAGVTANPAGEWVVQQARNLTSDLSERSLAARFLIRDRDTKFTSGFDEVFRTEGRRVIKTPIRSPRANAFAERFVGTVRRERTDRLLILGRTHLEQVLAGYAAHYNDHRPHRSLDQQAPRILEVAPDPINRADPTRLRRKAVPGRTNSRVSTRCMTSSNEYLARTGPCAIEASP